MRRYEQNPVIRPADVPPSTPGMEVIGAFNAAATRFGDEIILLLRVAERPIPSGPDTICFPMADEVDGQPVLRRVELRRDDPDADASDPRAVVYKGHTYLSSISHLRLARSKDGFHFTVDPQPTLLPRGPYERYGIEDPRITKIGDTYWIAYTSVSDFGITVSLASTQDFRSFTRHGVILHPENKDVALFPAETKHGYALLHRPYTRSLGSTPDIWLAYSPDLVHFGDHRHVAGVRPDSWESVRIGAGTPPIMTDKGWLELYHGADAKAYCLGLLLLDPDEPHIVRGRSREPVMQPETPYEKAGFYGNVVFTCGWVVKDDGRVLIYYGVSDEATAVAETTLDELLARVDPVQA